MGGLDARPERAEGTMMSVYLDHAATTPMLHEAIEAYTAALRQVGNPASIHSTGQHAKRMLEEARERIAETLSCDPIEVILTSGGTEAINLALKGLFWNRQKGTPRPIVVVPGGEHHATIDTVEWLERHEGAQLHEIDLDDEGFIRLDQLEAVLTERREAVAFVSAIAANNEVGTIQPLARIAGMTAEHGIPLHLDAVAAYGHMPLDFRALRGDAAGQSGLVALSVSAHKIGGPVSAGALVLSRQAAVEPLVHGGGQQRQVRSGTQDVAGAIAFATAAGLAQDRMATEADRLAMLRDRLITSVSDVVPDARLNGPRGELRLPGNVHFAFPGCEGDSLLFLLDMAGVAVSTGSACQAGIPEPSHVLRAMGRSEVEARGALRITLGHTTTDADVDAFIAALPNAYAQAVKAGFSDRTVNVRAAKVDRL